MSEGNDGGDTSPGRVTGIGGIFFKAADSKAAGEWYQKHLGIPVQGHGFWPFQWRDEDDPERVGTTVWSPFKADTDYFEPSESPFMVNYRVDDIDALLAKLKAAGVWIADKREDSEYGRFAWIMDPDGNKIELWEPPATEKESG